MTIAVGGATVLAGCSVDHDHTLSHRHAQTHHDALRFFTPEEARTVDAVIGRLVPGDENDPGAREAGALYYIDGKLADHEAFAEPTYAKGPFAEGVEAGEQAPPGTIPVAEDQLYRYGFQGADTAPQDLYRESLAALDRLSQEERGASFADLDPATQDEILTVLDDIGQAQEADESGQESDSATGGGPEGGLEESRLAQAAERAFGDVDPGAFFDRIRTDTIEGMFADPHYGGNRGMAGWALIGYPGPRRAWSPAEMVTPTRRVPTPLESLPPMNPDHLHGPAREALEQPRQGVVEG
ncbi:gluconate 2-dehydrogenase subunit 3 family protein [Microbacterium album]|nr:gluconate 2-dehydrogenase subunit 3 family protein [Microbacterium album]